MAPIFNSVRTSKRSLIHLMVAHEAAGITLCGKDPIEMLGSGPAQKADQRDEYCIKCFIKANRG